MALLIPTPQTIWIVALAVFVIGLGLFVLGLFNIVRQKRKNDLSPRVTETAKIVGKRTEVFHHPQNHAATDYYVTFEFGGGNRIELKVGGTEYGLLAENDVGELTYQGTRYLEFKRNGGLH